MTTYKRDKELIAIAKKLVDEAIATRDFSKTDNPDFKALGVKQSKKVQGCEADVLMIFIQNAFDTRIEEAGRKALGL